MLVVEAAQGVVAGRGDDRLDSRRGRSTARASAANSGSSSTIEDRLSHARPVRSVRRPPLAAVGAGQERQREGRPASRAAVRPIADREPAAVGLDQAAADVQAETGARDPRFADVPGPMERLEDERPLGLRDADALVVDRRRPASRRRTDAPIDDRRSGGRVLQRVARRGSRGPGRSRRRVDLDRRQVRRAGRRRGARRRPTAARSPRRRATSEANDDRRPLEDERVGVEVGHVEDLVDEDRRAGA